MQKTNIFLTQCALSMVRNQLSQTPHKMSFMRVPAQVGPQNIFALQIIRTSEHTYNLQLSCQEGVRFKHHCQKYYNYLHVYEMINTPGQTLADKL